MARGGYHLVVKTSPTYELRSHLARPRTIFDSRDGAQVSVVFGSRNSVEEVVMVRQFATLPDARMCLAWDLRIALVHENSVRFFRVSFFKGKFFPCWSWSNFYWLKMLLSRILWQAIWWWANSEGRRAKSFSEGLQVNFSLHSVEKYKKHGCSRWNRVT